MTGYEQTGHVAYVNSQKRVYTVCRFATEPENMTSIRLFETVKDLCICLCRWLCGLDNLLVNHLVD